MPRAAISLQIVVAAEHAMRRHQVGRQQAEPVQILRRRAAAIALADGLDLGAALRHVRRDGHAELTRPRGAGLQQIGTAGVGGVRAHRKTDAAVAAIVPALIEARPMSPCRRCRRRRNIAPRRQGPPWRRRWRTDRARRRSGCPSPPLRRTFPGSNS